MRGTTSRGRGPKNVRGCEKVVPALAYLFCLALPGSCLAGITDLFWELQKKYANLAKQGPGRAGQSR